MQQLKNLGAGGIIICNSLLTVIPFDTNQCNRHIKFRQEFTLKELDGRYPPKFIHSHKKKVYAALPPLSNEVLNEKVQVTKWDCIDYPDDIPIKSVAHQMFQDSFPYLIIVKSFYFYFIFIYFIIFTSLLVLFFFLAFYALKYFYCFYCFICILD